MWLGPPAMKRKITAFAGAGFVGATAPRAFAAEELSPAARSASVFRIDASAREPKPQKVS